MSRAHCKIVCKHDVWLTAESWLTGRGLERRAESVEGKRTDGFYFWLYEPAAPDAPAAASVSRKLPKNGGWQKGARE